MHSHIIQNGEIVELAKAKAAAISPATLYGHGVFTTIRVHGGRPFLWDLHWHRLKEHAERVRIDTSHIDKDQLLKSLLRLIESNRAPNCRARITVLARNITGAWNLKGIKLEGADVLIMTGDSRVIPEEGLALTVSPYRVNTSSPLTGLKTVNYLDHILAYEEARERDFDEALVLNERGEVASTSRANIFWVAEGKIHTPVLLTGALAGTTRAHVFELASQLAVPLIEGVYDLGVIGDADEIFLTSAGLGVAHVHTFDYRSYPIMAGNITVRVREAFHQSVLKGDGL